MGLSRAHRTVSVSKESTSKILTEWVYIVFKLCYNTFFIGVAEEQIERALSIYSSQYGATHEATIACKVLIIYYFANITIISMIIIIILFLRLTG